MRGLSIAILIAGAAGCGSKGKASAAATPADAAEPTTVVDAAAVEPAPARSAGDTAQRTAAAQAIIKPGTACVPKPSSSLHEQLGMVEGTPVLCMVQAGDGLPYQGPLACWSVDAASGALTYREPRPLPGLGFRVTLDGDGCAYGFCLPAKLDGEATTHIAWSTTGARVAIAVSTIPGDADRIHVFDAASKKLVRSIARTGDDGMHDSVVDLQFVQDVLFATGGDGLSSFVWPLSAGEQPLPPTDGLSTLTTGAQLDVSGGSVSVLDDHRLLLAELGVRTTLVVDAAAHTVAQTRRQRVPCSDDEIAGWETDNNMGVAPKKKCRAFLTKEVEPLVGASLVALPSGEYLAARRGKLFVIDAGSHTIKRTLSLPTCPT